MMLTERVSMHRTKTIESEAYISQREASQRIGVCQATMASLILRGIIPAKRVHGVRSVWVKESDVSSFMKGVRSESMSQAGH